MEHLASIQRAKQITMEQVGKELPSQVFALVTCEQDERVFDEAHQKGQFFSGLLLQQVDDHYEWMGSFKHESLPWLNIDD